MNHNDRRPLDPGHAFVIRDGDDNDNLVVDHDGTLHGTVGAGHLTL